MTLDSLTTRWHDALPGLGKVGPVGDHVAGQIPMAWKVDERFVKGLPEQILKVLRVHCPHPAGEAGDTSLHVEQVGVGTGPSDGQTTGPRLHHSYTGRRSF